jgi:hypothetical protein
VPFFASRATEPRASLSWLWLLVALQVAIPASYYLLRDDRDDERFAWRMFSTVRLMRCKVRAFDGKTAEQRTAIDLSRSLHASWQRSLERGRQHVIEHFLASRCELSEVRYSFLDRVCKGPSGQALPDSHYRYDCAVRRLEAVP